MSYLDLALGAEIKRQEENIELIASENYVDSGVLEFAGSILTNKYCEGYPEQSSIDIFRKQFPDYVHTGNIGRYYGGCENVDQIELYARHMFQRAFNTNYHVNVQPHSGSQANQAAYSAVLNPGDKILSMSLDEGAHLTHGSPVNFSGKIYNFGFYGLDDRGYIDIGKFSTRLCEFRPKLVVIGASAYPRFINFEIIDFVLKKFADRYGYKPILMVDMAHVAGLVAAGIHPTPFGYADIITTTTHKTLRGPRGGLIFCKPELAKRVDSAVFPGSQGGPLMHIIAAKGKCAEVACSEEFKQYQRQIIKNTAAMADEFIKLGYELVTGGTDNHLFLLNFTHTHPNITGLMVQEACDAAHITLNKNMVPGDSRTPRNTSGVRIGTAAMTTRGYKEEDFRVVAIRIDEIIRGIDK